MNLKEFVSEFGDQIESFKEYDSGVIRITFSDQSKVMWLKRLVCENLGMTVKDASVPSSTYWFKPA